MRWHCHQAATRGLVLVVQLRDSDVGLEHGLDQHPLRLLLVLDALAALARARRVLQTHPGAAVAVLRLLLRERPSKAMTICGARPSTAI